MSCLGGIFTIIILLWVFSCMNCAVCTNTLCVWFLLEPISFDPPFITITSCVPKRTKSFTKVFTISFVVALGLIQLQTSNFVFRYWFIFEAVPLRWLSPKIFTLWLVLVPVEIFTSSSLLSVSNLHCISAFHLLLSVSSFLSCVVSMFCLRFLLMFVLSVFSVLVASVVRLILRYWLVGCLAEWTYS